MKVSEAIDQLEIGDTVWVKATLDMINDKGRYIRVMPNASSVYLDGHDEISLTEPTPLDALAQEYDVEPDTIREWLDRGHKGSFEEVAPSYQYPIKTMPALIADITYRKNIARVALDKLDKEMYTTPSMRLAQQKYEIYSNVVKLLNDLEPAEQVEKVEVPDFVAEWYESNKHKLERAIIDVACSMEKGEFPYNLPFEDWFIDPENHPIETLIRMKDGYTVNPKRWVVRVSENTWVHNVSRNIYNSVLIDFSDSKKQAYPFTDKSKAEAVATLVEGSVEEV